ncbi:MAG: hypothetical protein LAO77_14585 [Acidobacteriia bacterium]|nr:hypothetical protein [Terriglobia bacterium]
MPLRIAFDLDGVLADMDTELVRHAEALFGEPMTRKLEERTADAEDPAKPGDAKTAVDDVPVSTRLHMTARQTRRLWQHVGSINGFWEGLKEIEPGTVARLAAVAADRRWEVIFLTKRPDTVGAIAQVQSQRWLEAKGFALPSVYVVQGSRGLIAAALHLDIVVDDRPENCLDVVVDSKARAILVWRDDEKNLPATARRLGIGAVKTVAECLDILTKVDSPEGDQPGIMARVMKLLGLNETARV